MHVLPKLLKRMIPKIKQYALYRALEKPQKTDRYVKLQHDVLINWESSLVKVKAGFETGKIPQAIIFSMRGCQAAATVAAAAATPKQPLNNLPKWIFTTIVCWQRRNHDFNVKKITAESYCYTVALYIPRFWLPLNVNPLVNRHPRTTPASDSSESTLLRHICIRKMRNKDKNGVFQIDFLIIALFLLQVFVFFGII